MRRHLPAIVAAFALGLVTTACAVDDRSFFIAENHGFTSVNGACEANTSSTRYQGVFDIAPNRAGGQFGYLMFPAVTNSLRPTSGDKEPERNGLNIKFLEVDLDTGSLNRDISFSVPAAFRLEPGATAAVSSLRAIPSEVLQGVSLPAGGPHYIIVTLRAVADRSSETVESAEFEFYVRLCDGCLVGKVLDTCPASTASSTVYTNACGIPQDTKVTCCRDPAFGVRCLEGSSS